MTAPRVRTVMETSYSGSYKYKGHFIDIDRDNDKFGWWYITVTAPNGMRDYDGWWRETGKTHREAVLEALDGAMLFPAKAKNGGAHATD